MLNSIFPVTIHSWNKVFFFPNVSLPGILWFPIRNKKYILLNIEGKAQVNNYV